jgi:hypothetical protein
MSERVNRKRSLVAGLISGLIGGLTIVVNILHRHGAFLGVK